MKKIFFLTILLGAMPLFVSASKYRVDENQLTKMVNQSIEVTKDDLNSSLLKESVSFSYSKKGGEKTRGGYLLRSFFCGAIALHRYYMGTNNKWMWAMYFCIPVVGPLNNFVDFWGAVFVSDFYKKYENNDKYIVWLD